MSANAAGRAGRWLGAVAMVWACACSSGGGGGSSGTTSVGSGSGSGGVVTTGGATTGGAGACSDNQDGNDNANNAFALPLEPTDNDLVNLQGVLCAGDSDWFEFQAPCTGYLGIEARCVDLEPEGGSGTGADGQCDGNDDFRVVVYEDGMEVKRSDGQFSLEAAHLETTGASTYQVQVEHVAGSPVAYSLRAYFLPRLSCASASWKCEIDQLSATETGCKVEPTPSCSSTESRSVAIPQTDDGQSGLFSGWAVHTSATEVANLHRPSTAEVALIESKCEEACEDEWSDDPDVSANCSDSDAFLDPALRAAGSTPTRSLIDESVKNGQGVFPGETVSCDLRDDCCEDFDELLCATVLDRVTPAPEMLGRGEEYRFALGNSEIELVTSAGTETASMTGTIGFSLCPQKNSSAACPFYLGSLELSTTQMASVTLDCTDGTQEVRRLNDLDLSLIQPAFGIDDQGDDAKGFPPAALLFDADITVDFTLYETWGTNLDNVVFDASSTSVLANDIELGFTVPCGDGSASVLARIDLEDTALLDSPPSATVSMSPTRCNYPMYFNASVSDPDSDLDETRWYVDDVLMSQGVSSIVVTQGHTYRVEARDDRGAVTSDEQYVGCL